MKIFFKYQLKEYFLNTFIFFLGFNILITLIKGIFSLQKLLELNASLSYIFLNFILIFLQFASFVYPLSAFIGVIFSIYRWKDEKELLAFYSLGFSFKDFLKSLGVFIFISFIITHFLHFVILPWAKRTQKLMKIQLIKREFNKPFPAKKTIPLGKNYILYVKNSKKRDDNHEFSRVFLLEKKGDKRSLFFAEKGVLGINKKFFKLIRGWVFSFGKNENIEVLKFDSYKFWLPLKQFLEIPDFSRGEKPFSELKNELKKIPPKTSRYYRYLTEYYNRILYAFSITFLILQGFLLGFCLRTHHKFLIFFIGILAYLLFYMIYQFLVSLGENGKIYPLWSFIIFYGFISLVLLIQIVILKKKRGIFLV